MSRYRHALPQLRDDLFLTDGGIETTLIFHDGLDLPEFAAFTLLRSAEGSEALGRYFRSYADVARRHALGLVLESPTWRSNPDWGRRLGYSREELADANRDAVALIEEVRSEYETPFTPVVLSGCVGPRGDGYRVEDAMSATIAEAYHAEQVGTFAETAADMVCAITMTYVDEAIGVARAAEKAGLPVAISFTVETDGSIPAGETLAEAVERVDDATDGYASYFMINCAHPSHFSDALDEDRPWVRRLRGLRANASRLSHEELDAAEDLDTGDPKELGADHADLKRRLPHLAVMGGCCGTDTRHIEEIAIACAPLLE